MYTCTPNHTNNIYTHINYQERDDMKEVVGIGVSRPQVMVVDDSHGGRDGDRQRMHICMVVAVGAVVGCRWWALAGEQERRGVRIVQGVEQLLAA